MAGSIGTGRQWKEHPDEKSRRSKNVLLSLVLIEGEERQNTE